MVILLENEIETQLSEDIQEVILLTSKATEETDYKTFLIGGVVRDLILNRAVLDIDIIVEGDAICFAESLVKSSDAEIIQVQETLRTAKVLFKNGQIVDYASTRSEYYPESGCLPVIKSIGCPLSEDVLRRDFTINTLAVSLNKDSKFELVDYLNGYQDILDKKIKVLHQKSYADDPSRIVRALKFAVRLGFEPDNETYKQQKDFLSEIKCLTCPKERIRSEFEQLFNLNSAKAYDEVIKQKIYKLLTNHANTDITGHLIEKRISLFNINQDQIWLVYLGCLLLYAEDCEINSLNLSGMELKIIHEARLLLENKFSSKIDNYTIYKTFAGVDILSLLVYYIFSTDKNVVFYLNELKDIAIELNGKDLIEMGVVPSPLFKELLDKILEEKLNNGLSSKNDEIAFIKQFL
ncbi:MAG: hypothetical protein PHV37_09525 [Candidatus Gastranaerophilales bacterium]|nr:hypothetical protein [Candidatus Gastranaerophilales bacterium]